MNYLSKKKKIRKKIKTVVQSIISKTYLYFGINYVKHFAFERQDNFVRKKGGGTGFYKLKKLALYEFIFDVTYFVEGATCPKASCNSVSVKQPNNCMTNDKSFRKQREK